jgi:transposase
MTSMRRLRVGCEFEHWEFGLYVHARSVVACRLDGRCGGVIERRLTPDYGELPI